MIQSGVLNTEFFNNRSSSRIYQHKKSNEEVKKELIDYSGTQFDADLVNLFLETI